MNESHEENPVGSKGFRPRNRREARLAKPLPAPDYAPLVLNEDGTISSAHPERALAGGFRDDSSSLGIPQPAEVEASLDGDDTFTLPEGSRSDRLKGSPDEAGPRDDSSSLGIPQPAELGVDAPELAEAETSLPEGSRSDRLEGSPAQTFASFADIIAGNATEPADSAATFPTVAAASQESADETADFSFKFFEALAADTADEGAEEYATDMSFDPSAEHDAEQPAEQPVMATAEHFAEAIKALSASRAHATVGTGTAAAGGDSDDRHTPSSAVWSLDDHSNEPFSFPPVEVAVAADEPAPPTAVYDLNSSGPQPVVQAAPVVDLDGTVHHLHVLDEVETTDDDPFQINASDVEQADANQADTDLLEALRQVLVLGASDLHVTVGAAPNIRIHGGLQALEGQSKWMREKVTSALYSLLTDEQRERFEEALELDFAYSTSGARFRVNYYVQRNSIGAAFRLIPREIKQLKALGVPESVSRFAELARGLVLVTGPTGSGKSTTLAALVDLVNRTRADHIVTVEDPIEFLHAHQKSLVNQREVGHDTHSFAAALKHVLRQDPDVILIGELRDLETISVALTAAETGHLVFATLHTQDAASTIDRVIDVFPPHQQGQVRTQLAATLRGVVCQTLVKTVNGRGRVVATEVLVTTPAVSNLIREGKTYQIPSALQAGKELGMHSMDQHLAELVDAGKITHAAAMDKAHDLEGLKQLISRVDTGSSSSGQMSSAAGLDYDAHADGRY